MKKLFISLMFLFSLQIFAQTGAYFYYQLPEMPGAICVVDTSFQGQFMRQLGSVGRQLDEVYSKKKKEVQKEADNLKPEMEKKIAKDSGLSDADIQKLKNKNLSKEEKKKIADKMLQNKANISMEEIERLKKMSKEGKEAWAEAYSTEVMANMQSGDSVKTEEQIKMEKELDKNTKLNELVKEQKLIIDRIYAVDKKYANQMEELRKEDSIQTVILEAKLEPLRKQLLGYPTKEQQKSIYQEMAQHYLTYCNKLSPMNINMIANAKESLEPLLPEYDRLEELNTEINKIMLGAKDGLNSPGLMQLGAVKSLINIMADTYSYTIPQDIALKVLGD
jgi:type I site-specific restriction endonuclease